MATFLPGPTIAEARGSIGGVVYSRNRGGMYMRNRSVPTNPNTARQQNVRLFMLTAAQYFSETLIAADRKTWEVYTQNTPATNRVGATIVLSGIAAFVRTNALRQLANLAILDKAPATGGEATAIKVNAPGISISAATQEIVINADTDLGNWSKDIDDDACIFSQGLPVDPNVLYFKGPFRTVYSLNGDSTSPHAFPFTIACVFAVQEGQVCYMKFKHLDAEGKVSNDSIVPITVAA